MNSLRQARFDDLARLFRYPLEDYAADAAALAARLSAERSAAADSMREFVQYTGRASLHELEEAYTRTFDLNPSCSPEIGWHLFGEEYVRGLFMVRMRNEMRERGLDISGHRARQLTPELVHAADLVLVMESGHKKAIEAEDPTTWGKVFRLGEWRDIDIADPFRQPREAYEAALELIDKSVADWVERLKN